ncbi:MAG: hypothetical protein Q9182_006627 [Xanthomendoza sp. 2 TL-2023]
MATLQRSERISIRNIDDVDQVQESKHPALPNEAENFNRPSPDPRAMARPKRGGYDEFGSHAGSSNSQSPWNVSGGPGHTGRMQTPQDSRSRMGCMAHFEESECKTEMTSDVSEFAYCPSQNDHNNEKVQEILRVLAIIPETHPLFYHHSTFHISGTDLPAFLSYLPSNSVSAVRPKPHIRHLEIRIQPMMHWEARQHAGAGALPLLLDCPELRQLEVLIEDRFEGVCEFEVTLGRIAETCVALGEKLGEADFKVQGRYLYGGVEWTVREFRERRLEVAGRGEG